MNAIIQRMDLDALGRVLHFCAAPLVSLRTGISTPLSILAYNVVRLPTARVMAENVQNVLCAKNREILPKNLKSWAFDCSVLSEKLNSWVQDQPYWTPEGKMQTKEFSNIRPVPHSNIGPLENFLVTSATEFLGHLVSYYDLLQIRPYFGLNDNHRVSFFTAFKIHIISVGCFSLIGYLRTNAH